MGVSARLFGLLEAFTVVVLLCASAALVFLMLNPSQPLAVDFAPVWAAATNPLHAYDMAAVTRVQSEVFGLQLNPRPFAYPPTALLLLLPLGSVPLFTAYTVFVFASFVGFVWTGMRAGSPWWVSIFPPVILLAHVGQPTLLVGGLMLAGFLVPDWRLRGLLFGFAVAIKPQLCLFLPVALLLHRDWRTVLLAGGAIGVLAVAATAAFGAAIWQDWITAMTSLRAQVLSSPSLSANMLHTSPLIFGIPAILLVWLTRNANPSIRFGGTVGAALLVSPYAMNYELALLAPAVASSTRLNPWMLIAALVLGLAFFMFEMAVLIAILTTLVWVARSAKNARLAPDGECTSQINRRPSEAV